MPKKNISPSNRSADYQSFLKSVKLYHIALDDVSAKLERDLYWESTRNKRKFVRTIDTSFEAQNADDDHFDVLGGLTLKITVENEDKSMLLIHCTFVAHFHASGVMSRSTDRFANAEAKLILWPYLRQLVTDLTARMSIPPITIPISLTT